jgi:hypothetical protein
VTCSFSSEPIPEFRFCTTFNGTDRELRQRNEPPIDLKGKV